MRCKKFFIIGIILFLSLTSEPFAEEYSLQYFLAKASVKEYELSKEEKTEVLSQIDRLLEKVYQVQRSLLHAIQGGEVTMPYQEGKFWMAKLEEDRASIESGMEQIKLLKERADQLTPSIKLYKALRDLSVNFNAYNNMPLLSGYVGDLAPEIGLWADPVFYRFYLVSLASSKDKEVNKSIPPTQKKPAQKNRKP